MKLIAALRLRYSLGGRLIALWLFTVSVAVKAEPLHPLEDFPLLFPAVQFSEVFPSDKTFTNAIPKHSPEEIEQRYRQFLHDFVQRNFVLPQPVEYFVKAKPNASLAEHAQWVMQQRYQLPPVRKYDTLIDMPYNYAIGGAARELYYWDSYFSALGFAQLGMTNEIKQMLANMTDSIDRIGYVANSNRSYTQSRSNPPVFSLLVALLAETEGPRILRQYLPYLVKEYQYWMSGSNDLSSSNYADGSVVRMPDGAFLNRYWDSEATPRVEYFTDDIAAVKHTEREPNFVYRNIRASVASGWDLSNRWLKRPNKLSSVDTIDVIPVDLNVLLYHLEQTIADGYRYTNNAHQSERFDHFAKQRADAIQHYLWDGELGLYQDLLRSSGAFSGRLSIATVFPLWMQIATPEQAHRVATNIEHRFLRAGGVMMTEIESIRAFAWDAPNGWAPLQWITVDALRHYQHDQLAQKVAQRWISLNQRYYQKHGQISVVYDVVAADPDGDLQLSFSGENWAAGVLLQLLRSYPQYQSWPQGED